MILVVCPILIELIELIVSFICTIKDMSKFERMYLLSQLRSCFISLYLFQFPINLEKKINRTARWRKRRATQRGRGQRLVAAAATGRDSQSVTVRQSEGALHIAVVFTLTIE